MTVNYPQRCYACLSHTCHMHVFGQRDDSVTTECPKCKGPVVPASHEEWIGCMIASKCLAAGHPVAQA